MIFDKIENSWQYLKFADKIQKGFEFLSESDLINMKDGKYNIQGDEIYANVQSLTTKSVQEAKWEVHRQYIDIQYLIEGNEKIGYGTLSDFNKVVVPYDKDKDIEFLDGNIYNFVDIKPGNFVIFFKNDVHAPMLSVKDPQKIKKVIVKIKI